MRVLRTLLRVSCAFVPALLVAFFLFTASTAAGSGAATVTVEICDNCFKPDTVTVNVGDTVTWMQMGQRPHDVTAQNGAFSSPRRMMNGASFSYTATAPGTYNYECTIHAGMNGVLMVQAAGAPGAGGAPPAPPRTGAGGMAPPERQPWLPLLGIGLLVVTSLAGGAALRLRRRAA